MSRTFNEKERASGLFAENITSKSVSLVIKENLQNSCCPVGLLILINILFMTWSHIAKKVQDQEELDYAAK